MKRPRLRKIAAAVIALTLTLAAGVPPFGASSYAAVPKMTQIRVALFIDNGKNPVATVPTVTLSSVNGLAIGVKTPAGTDTWLNTADATPVRASLDSYRVLLMETNDAAAAEALYRALEGGQDRPYLFLSEKRGKPVYRVYTGFYATKDEAVVARERIAKGAAAAWLKTRVPVVVGPLHWNAGTHATAEAANRQLATLKQSGIDAFLAVHGQGGAVTYSVLVGEAADANALNAAKLEAEKAAPGLTLAPVDPKTAYLLVMSDVSPGFASGAGSQHYLINGFIGGEQAVSFSPLQAGAGVQVDERGKRKYRGTIELSRYNDRLAVINELPFEQYLVSVVGAEMNGNWPAEALKAQAVAARTFALRQGMKYGIAHVSDSTSDQVYMGIGAESEGAASAVRATEGEVLLSGSGLAAVYFHSNGGGMTGDPVEVWGQPIDHAIPVPSPDEGAQAGKLDWYRVVLENGDVGYIRSDFVAPTGGKTALGLDIVLVRDTDVNVRPAPYVNDTLNKPIAKVNTGDRLIVLEKTPESNAYAWIRGPYTAGELRDTIESELGVKLGGPLMTLEVGARGPSGRVTELRANGTTLPVDKPDRYRNALYGAPSTRFEIEEMGRMTVLGANGNVRNLPEANGPLYVLGAGSSGGGGTNGARALTASNVFLYGGNGQLRVASTEPRFRLIGKGNGHGLGMSQWGAKGLAELGYDYKKILQYYYAGVTIAKD